MHLVRAAKASPHAKFYNLSTVAGLLWLETVESLIVMICLMLVHLQAKRFAKDVTILLNDNTRKSNTHQRAVPVHQSITQQVRSLNGNSMVKFDVVTRHNLVFWPILKCPNFQKIVTKAVKIRLCVLNFVPIRC